MAKQQHQIREAANQNQYAVERHITIDDNLLPCADELAKFNEIKPAIVDWLMQRAEKEQDARIKFNFESLTLAKHSLWIAFSIAFIAMTTAIVFALIGKEIAGAAFSVISVIMYVQAFLRFGRNQKQ